MMFDVDLNNKTVFITGVAGFIGSYLAKRLLKENITGLHIVGLNNMNDYYDVSLKKYRLQELESRDEFTFIKGDIADKAAIASVLTGFSPKLFFIWLHKQVCVTPLQIRMLI